MVLLTVAALGAGYYLKRSPSAVSSPENSTQPATEVEGDAAQAKPEMKDPPDAAVHDAGAEAAPAATAAVPSIASLPEPTAQTRQLVANLTRFEDLRAGLSQEQAQAWKQNLQQLVLQGKDGVSAIREFLKQNKDLDLGSAGQVLGYGSVRRAMFDALTQIGGWEAIDVMRQNLQSNADPREIALLAEALNKMAPDEYREETLQAVRETLALAASGKLEGADVGPLFEVLKKYGGASAAPELEQSLGQWKYYATMALSQLPDGAGVGALIQLAQGTTPAKVNALEHLAQLSAQYPEAKAALVEQVRANNIPANLWPYLVSGLVGDEYHVQSSELDDTLNRVQPDDVSRRHVKFGNQNLYLAPGPDSFLPETIQQRLAFIEELRAITSEPAAGKALQESQSILNKRLPRTASAASSP